MVLEIVWLAFLGSSAIQFIYLLVVFGRFAYFYKIPKAPTPDLDNTEGVTVVVAARNEEKHLSELLPLLAEQDYPNFEILIVNDRSTDGTRDLLEKMLDVYPQLRTVTIKYTPRHVTAKKYALTLGIKTAKYDIILLTDADCRPASKRWIQQMTHPLRTSDKTIVLGHGGYYRHSGLLNRLIQYETLLTATQFFSFATWRAPFMGVGRNLCYRKAFFMEKKAFKGIWHVNGGDDDLFVNRYANAANTAVVVGPQSITLSTPKKDWQAYFVQKKRHFHAGKHYAFKDKIKLGGFMLSQLVFWISAIFLLIGARSWEPIAMVVGLMLSRAAVHFSVLASAKKKLEGIDNVYGFMFFDLVYMIYFWVVGTNGYLSKTVKWK